MRRLVRVGWVVLLVLFLAFSLSCSGEKPKSKMTPKDVLFQLKEGNKRFFKGDADNPRADKARLKLAGSKSQADYALATVLSCSDSRVPVEILFDQGIMDLFVVRVAGNVVNTDEAGSIEYGLAHVKTPLLVVLGHTQCGAVTAVTEAVQGHGHPLERNIPPLVATIQTAVERAMAQNPEIKDKAIVPRATEENVWVAIENLFMVSPATRQIVASGKAQVVGAIYDVATGQVEWLPQERVGEILKQVEENPDRAMEAMAGGH